MKRAVCQVRFPQILKIDSALPVDFQEAIRDRFPVFEKKFVASIHGMSAELLQLVNNTAGIGAYTFRDETNHMQVTLNSSSISYAVNQPTRWETISDSLYFCIEALIKAYNPTFFSRVGLRYTNVIYKSRLGLDDIPWSELINSDLLGGIRNSYFLKYAIDSRNTLRLKDELGFILIQYGYNVKEKQPDISSYILDFDIYQDERCEIHAVTDFVERAHARARRILRWSITDKLHEAMGPRPCP